MMTVNLMTPIMIMNSNDPDAPDEDDEFDESDDCNDGDISNARDEEHDFENNIVGSPNGVTITKAKRIIIH